MCLLQTNKKECLHCNGTESACYCEKCYQDLISKNATLQLEINRQQEIINDFKNVKLFKMEHYEIKKRDSKIEEQIEKINKVTNENDNLLLKNLKAEKYIRNWIKDAEEDWCSDINDYIGISGLYEILRILGG